jgi:hypothetical protein
MSLEKTKTYYTLTTKTRSDITEAISGYENSIATEIINTFKVIGIVPHSWGKDISTELNAFFEFIVQLDEDPVVREKFMVEFVKCAKRTLWGCNAGKSAMLIFLSERYSGYEGKVYDKDVKELRK